MIAPWMLWATLFGALVFVSAVAVEHGLHLARTPVRGVWALALLVVTVAPLGLAARRPRAADHPNVADPVTHSASSIAPQAQPQDRSVMRAPARKLDARTVDETVLILWALASAVLGGRLLLAVRRLRRCRRGWASTEIDGVRVLLSEGDGPAVAGVFRPVIVIPDWLATQSAETRRIVLCHEQEHCRACDPLLLALASTVVALLPWNPALWALRRRLRLAVEVDCDARVLDRGLDASAYGSLLLTVAERRTSALAPALMEPRTFLERRIRAMIRIRPRHPIAHAGLAASVCALTIVLACQSPRPAPLLPAASQNAVAPPADAPAAVPSPPAPSIQPPSARRPAVRREPLPSVAAPPMDVPATLPAQAGQDPISLDRLKGLVAVNYPDVARNGSGDQAVFILMDSTRSRMMFETWRAPLPQPLTGASVAQVLHSREEMLLPPWRTSYATTGPGSPTVEVVVARVRPDVSRINDFAIRVPSTPRNDSINAWWMALQDTLMQEIQRRWPEVLSGDTVRTWFVITQDLRVLRAQRDTRPPGARGRPDELEAATVGMTAINRGAMSRLIGVGRGDANFTVVSNP